ncbi:glutamate carboxypeptidase [Pseudoduganella chitinolytica]|uniref:Glutamate carboxypeptidase n=1 Tax=Pseudoduganella chitinolytica TaxID=34070 RepID=A0ABY8B7C1_9BURK|nr:glutamate carboxypeptidase [Pseudoduganella chitinolytica]WEF30898.1 glutamate carboxypeptidase [Pseudoduganella chitinolytica]
MRNWLAGVALVVMGGAHAAAPDAALLAKAEQHKAPALALLQKLVDIDSGTFSAKGLDAVGAVAAAELTRLGFRVQTFAATPALSNNIVATLDGTGRGRILLVAHMDTVFGDGTAKAHPFRIDGKRAYGPGIMDDKGGIVIGIHALAALREQGFDDFKRITVLLNTNEETGSHGSRALIERVAKEHDVVFNLEPGRPADGLVVSRKGSGDIELAVHGKASHAGVAPKQGVNAALEAAHQLVQLSQLGDEAKQTTVNWTVVQGGERSNVIPDRATAQADVRVMQPEEFDRVERDMRRLAARQLVPEARVEIALKRSFPPMPPSPTTDALARTASAIYAELGRKLTLESSGGAADSSLVFAAGVPTIDGLGIVGGGIHTAEEYAEVDSIAPRIYLLARLIRQFGKDPQLPR